MTSDRRIHGDPRPLCVEFAVGEGFPGKGSHTRRALS